MTGIYVNDPLVSCRDRNTPQETANQSPKTKPTKKTTFFRIKENGILFLAGYRTGYAEGGAESVRWVEVRMREERGRVKTWREGREGGRDGRKKNGLDRTTGKEGGRKTGCGRNR